MIDTAGESQMVPSSSPDPSVMTMEAIERAIESVTTVFHSELRVIVTRINAMDEATRVLHETVTRIPTDVQQAVRHLRELTAVELVSVAQRFNERDTRSERESRDNKVAVDAAFAAQKEAAAKQDEANQKAIDKSEKATNETIAKNADADEARARALSDKIDDLKERVTRAENLKIGAVAERTESRQMTASAYGFIGALIGVVSFIAYLLGNQQP